MNCYAVYLWKLVTVLTTVEGARGGGVHCGGFIFHFHLAQIMCSKSE